jgi:hypothetical protein
MLNNFPAGLLAIMVSLYLFFAITIKQKKKEKKEEKNWRRHANSFGILLIKKRARIYRNSFFLLR